MPTAQLVTRRFVVQPYIARRLRGWQGRAPASVPCEPCTTLATLAVLQQALAPPRLRTASVEAVWLQGSRAISSSEACAVQARFSLPVAADCCVPAPAALGAALPSASPSAVRVAAVPCACFTVCHMNGRCTREHVCERATYEIPGAEVAASGGGAYACRAHGGLVCVP